MNDYEYHDRKMMKWMPFNALTEAGTFLDELLSKRVKQTMPLLSVDDYELMNYTIEEAVALNYPVSVHYYKDGAFYDTSGYITHQNHYYKTITINEIKLSASQIVLIEKSVL